MEAFSANLGNRRIEVVRGDIVKERVDAIVNAANSTLLGGGGVDGAIHRAAGPDLLEECRGLDGCGTGDAKITRGYRLSARFVIHAVGPIYRGGQEGEAQLLDATYRRCMVIAAEHRLQSLAFPAISTGAYGYPRREAAGIAFRRLLQELRSETTVERVRYVLFDASAFETHEEVLRELLTKRS
ncbi:MAG: O-acetyl-ADP-ribose deacetylase [Planctomycetes bacterium]|nr:O-acetyl-ADP-ribose deacetylase [Planctomycetota bacterium]